MAQTKKGSFAESAANIAVGFGINFTANWLIFPLFGAVLTLKSNFYIGCIYTVISLVRSYVLRRWFNGLKFGNAAPEFTVRPYPNPAADSGHRMECSCKECM